ncbi:hypothetical protein CC80DRAFT_491522 [Byssothecium circinans]|uniref:Uncharacterized protein n=1 Tax=Byssothecium circinans TaxID=147558 RepID=A0A6A5U348_9PLEO|nr:hypothetical protein CC80DRAFT_491522 [Byssothecium circinans]
MADVRTILSNTLYVIWWPTSKALNGIRFILSPFWALLQFIFLPLTHLIQAILSIVLLPFRLDILERIETIYIWLGIASVVGAATGVFIFFVYKFLTSAFHIDTASQAKAPPRGRTVKEYRTARRGKNGSAMESSGPAVMKIAAPRRRGLLSQPIMEEESEF